MHFKKQTPTDTAPVNGSSGDAADAAVDAHPIAAEHHQDSPHARRVAPLGKNEKPDQLADKKAAADSDEEALLDEGIEESYPASDPVSANHFT